MWLCIEDDRVEIRDAGEYWGKGLIECQLRFRDDLGPDWRVVAIGPAGENGCRFAILATGTESAAGQGGFGAVMGSKNLKAVAVRGHGGVPVAQPREMLRRSRNLVEAIFGRYGKPEFETKPVESGNAIRHPAPCTYQCPRSCGDFYQDMPREVQSGQALSGHMFCCSPIFANGSRWIPKMGLEGGFELTQVCNDLGLNHWEFIFGLGPWLSECQERGELLEIGGERIDLESPAFWMEMGVAHHLPAGLGAISSRRAGRGLPGIGASARTSSASTTPPGGQASHWDGHGSFTSPFFPLWLVPALQWALDVSRSLGRGDTATRPTSTV